MSKYDLREIGSFSSIHLWHFFSFHVHFFARDHIALFLHNLLKIEVGYSFFIFILFYLF